MKEKLLALLVAKFPGMRKDGLAQVAGALSLQTQDETEATALIEKISQEQTDTFIKDWRREIDKEVSESNKTFEGNLKKKYDFVERQDGGNPANTTPPANTTNPEDIAAIVANAVKAAVEPFQRKISAFEGQQTTKTRLQQLESKFTNVPESYKAQRLNDAALLIGTMDDTQFAEYSQKVETDINAFNQELADKGLSNQSKPLMGNQDANGVSSAVSSYITTKKEGEGKNLGGKEI